MTCILRPQSRWRDHDDLEELLASIASEAPWRGSIARSKASFTWMMTILRIEGELIKGQRLPMDEEGEVLVWAGNTVSVSPPCNPRAGQARPAHLPPPPGRPRYYLRSALEGGANRSRSVCDLKGPWPLAERDPEEARQVPIRSSTDDGACTAMRQVNQIWAMVSGALGAPSNETMRCGHPMRRWEEARCAVTVTRCGARTAWPAFRIGINAAREWCGPSATLAHDYSAIGQDGEPGGPRMEQLDDARRLLLTQRR